MKAVLNHTSFEKVPGLVMDLKEMGIKIHVPDINGSEIGFCILNGELWYGLGSIKGIGDCQKKYVDIVEKIREIKPDTDICENQ
ncbi:MAG: hypothetical protein HFG55_07800 [Lachnospiraceae bacterium]|nr:hypothetical protein [Lachnospiraceae bacterium]